MPVYQAGQELHVVADRTHRVRNAMEPEEAQRVERYGT
jgi:hypothetical protein